jgi:hypothetical protein
MKTSRTPKAKFSGDLIPQANTLGRVVDVVNAVAAGHTSSVDLARELGCVERQGRYYRKAAVNLRLVKESAGHFALTGLGRKLVNAAGDPYRQQRVLRQAILKNPALKALHAELGRGRSFDGLVEWLARRSDLNQKTASRRLESIVNWLTYAGLAYTANERLKAIPA